jgi:hypothetical protein
MIETATGRRTPSGVMTSGMPGVGASRDVDIVVADAEARHHREAPIGMDALAREARQQQDQGVEVGRAGRRGSGLRRRYRRLTPGACAAGSTSKSGKVGEPSAFLKSPTVRRGTCQPWHHRFLQPARSSATASVSAFCRPRRRRNSR